MKTFKDGPLKEPYIGQVLHNKKYMSEWEGREVTVVVERIGRAIDKRAIDVNNRYSIWSGCSGKSFWEEIADLK